MRTPTIVDIPHQLGREEAVRRLRARVGELASHVPGAAQVRSSWPSEDRMTIEVAALGQTVGATIDVEARLVRVSFVLPAMLGFFSGAIADATRRKGAELLLGDGGAA